MKGWGAEIVSTVVTIGFIAVVFVWLIRPIEISGEALQVLNVLVGSLAASFVTVVNYWLGSSAGSANKDRLLMKQPEPPAEPTNG